MNPKQRNKIRREYSILFSCGETEVKIWTSQQECYYTTKMNSRIPNLVCVETVVIKKKNCDQVYRILLPEDVWIRRVCLDTGLELVSSS